MPARTVLKEFELAEGILYGPVRSRRLGTSLGINILPFSQKVCSFNCNYCQCGWTTDVYTDKSVVEKGLDFPTAQQIEMALAAHLKEAAARGEKYDSLTLAGNGEPTLHPDFANVVRGVVRARDGFMRGARTSILSNAATLYKPAVLEGLDLLDERIMKLDAGNDDMMLTMNTPLFNLTVREIVDGIKKLKDCVLQTMFVRGRMDNTGDADVEDWMRVVGEIHPRSVQIYSLDRVPADPKLQPVDRATLERIAKNLTDRTGVPAEVF